MQTEFPGPRAIALLQEMRQRGWRRSAWRVAYELRKRFGLIESSFRTEPLDVEELCTLFTPSLEGANDVRRLVRERLDEVFFLTPARRDAYVQAVRGACPDRHHELIQAAEAISQGRFELMGRTFDFAGGEINWHLAPETGRDWPRLRWNRFDLYDADAPGDVKSTWELNRHQFWLTLGRAYWLTGEERFAAAWAEQGRSWLDQNPPEIGVNWRSNLEHALRILNWWVALAFFLRSEHVSDDLVCRLVGTMILKARHILGDLDYSQINMPNNHLLGDAMGLAIMGLLLPTLKEADAWRDVGLETMWQEASRQIYPDGASFECAISYHRFVAYFFLVVTRLCDRCDVTVPDVVRQRLEGMFDFVMHLRRPDGSMPSLGDWDDGRTVILSEQPLGDFRPMLSTGAVLFARPDFAWAAGKLDEETIWLLGPEAAERFNQLHATPPNATSRAFRTGGYFISRSAWDRDAHYALIRNGPFESHTHADLLNVELAAGGQPILVDPGTYTYNGPWQWRTYFRSGGAHNGFLVDGRPQTYAHRIFRWVFPPRAKTIAWHATERIDYYEGEHDGFRRLPGRPVHRRIVLSVRGEYWLVLDGVLGSGSHEAELRLHFSPDLQIEPREGQLTASSDKGPQAAVAYWSSCPVTARLARGEEDPILGWYSSGYGRKEPSTTARLVTSGSLPLWVAWLVVPFEGRLPRVSLEGEPKEDRIASPTQAAVRLRIVLPNQTDRFAYDPSSEGKPVELVPGHSMRAGAVWVRLDGDTGAMNESWVRP